MPEYSFRLTIIFQTFENDTELAEALFFPEISRFGDKAKKLENAVKENVVRLVEEDDALALYRRHFTSEPELGEARVTVNPPPKSIAWQKPIDLTFQILLFTHGEDLYIAHLPQLGIEIIGRNREELEEKIPAEIHAHLLRIKKNRSLGELFWLQRAKAIRLARTTFDATIRTPKQIAKSQYAADEEKKSELEKVATDLVKEHLPEAFEIDETVTRIADALGGRHPRSVLLVGKSGVGKTAAVYELVRRRAAFRLSRTPFYATSGSRLVAGMSGFGMWQERCGKVWREAAKQKAILHFGNLLELMEVGKSTANNQGIASFFRPYISRGDLLCIAECAPEQLPIIEREAPNLLDAFLQIKVDEPTVERGSAILLHYAIAQSGRESPVDLEAIETIDRLHRRYATYSAYPGRPLRFLKNLLQDRKGGSINAAMVTARFSEETGLPLFLLNDDLPLDLAATQKFFSERVIGQASAVELVVNLLATVKARLTRAGKPIASLMFIGPTGVGKTEMAKALAEFLFQNRNRLIRFDMSEYADVNSIGRLIGGAWGKEGLLTAKVREQPFAVILLDEFEKAHPSFFDLLLQVLGEGRLTDAMGRVADFTNAVVIMTSNLGAETYKRNALGFRDATDATAQAREHFMKAVQAFVRPEFFNRIDRIVPFTPLDEATVLKIAHRELQQITRRDGIFYRGVELNITEQVAERLARIGYDARYGARPLKRAIERELLVPISEALNLQTLDVGLQAEVTVEGDELSVAVRLKTDEAGRVISKSSKSAPFAELVKQAAKLRRDAQNLRGSIFVQEIQNEIFNLERLAMRLAKNKTKNKWQDPAQATSLARLPDLKNKLQALEVFVTQTAQFEDAVLFCFYGKETGDKNGLQAQLAGMQKQWTARLLEIYGLQFKKPDAVTVALYSENANWLFELARAYFEIAKQIMANVEVVEFAVPSHQESEAIKLRVKAGEKVEVFNLLGRVTIKRQVKKPEEFLSAPNAQTVGIVLGIAGEMVFPRFEPEHDLHAMTVAKQTHNCLVHTSEARLEDYLPVKELDKRGSIKHQDARRLYNRDDSSVEDLSLEEKFYLDRDNLVAVVHQAIERRLLKSAQGLLDE
ncbi:MAG: AAA family ATPase [Acidobacteriota bacterium]